MKPFQCLAVPVAALVLCLALLPAIAVAAAPAADRHDIELKINTLLAHMTLAEKLGQMSQTGFPDKLTEKVKSEIRIGRWGSFYGGADPSMKAEMQRIAMKESRLGIPLIFGADLIHGFRTTFPIPLGESCSWNPELIQQAARVAAHEARPGRHSLDLLTHDGYFARSALGPDRGDAWRRPSPRRSIGGRDGARAARPIASRRRFDRRLRENTMSATARPRVAVITTPPGFPKLLLRNVYLVPFAAANEAGIASYMSAFNDLNGVPASANTFTLRQVLRDEWKFDGIVVSDYESVKELIPHGYAADERDAAMKAIKAGVDMEMVSTSYYNYGKSLIDSGQLDPRLIDQSVRNILRIKFRLGLFGAKGTQMPEGPRGANTGGAGCRQDTGRAKPGAARKMTMRLCRSRNPSGESRSSDRWRTVRSRSAWGVGGGPSKARRALR